MNKIKKDKTMRLKYICPNCGTKRIKREYKEILEFQHKQIILNCPLNEKPPEFPLIVIMVTCRKCHIKGVNFYEYLDSLDFLMPKKINECEHCKRKTKKLYILRQQESSNSYGTIVCKKCKEIGIKEGMIDANIKIY